MASDFEISQSPKTAPAAAAIAYIQKNSAMSDSGKYHAEARCPTFLRLSPRATGAALSNFPALAAEAPASAAPFAGLLRSPRAFRRAVRHVGGAGGGSRAGRGYILTPSDADPRPLIEVCAT